VPKYSQGDPVSVLAFPVRAEKLVREWTQKHRAELADAWTLCASKQQPNKIEPLE
jgi:hypothetical protein